MRSPRHVRAAAPGRDNIAGMTTTDTSRQTSGPAMVRSVGDVVLAEAAACEELRTTTAPVVDAMWDAG